MWKAGEKPPTEITEVKLLIPNPDGTPDWIVRAKANMVLAMRADATADSLILWNAVPRGLCKDEARQAQWSIDAAYYYRCLAIKMLVEKRVP